MAKRSSGEQNPDYNPSDYPPFAVTSDLVILTIRPPQLQVLLVRRTDDPFSGRWSLPGGFVGPNQDLGDAARSTLQQKTGVAVDATHLEQLATFGAPKRDPRMRIVSVAWLALMADPPDLVSAPADTDSQAAGEAAWIDVASPKARQLAFDHDQILAAGIERARSRIEYTTLAAQFCDAEFTIGELRTVYETLWGEALDAANFHRKVMATDGFVIPTGDTVSRGKGRPARTYRRGPAMTLTPPLQRPEST